MAPKPDPSATTATISDSARPAAITTRDGSDKRGAARAGAGSVIGRIAVGITGAIVGAVCGVTAAVLATTSVIAGNAPQADPVTVAALAGPSLAGRWSGAPYAVQNDAARCNSNGECKLVLDIVPCASGWCGIEVDQKNACAAEAMQLTTHSETQRSNAFQGKLSLAKGTQDYVIEAQLEPAGDGRPAMLEIVGDTGPEFRMFRRSFPFHTALTRVGDATCKSTDKPVS